MVILIETQLSYYNNELGISSDSDSLSENPENHLFANCGV
jgi:hypothetical protein